MAKNSAYYSSKKQAQITEYRERLRPYLPQFAVDFLNSKHQITQSTMNSYAKDLLMFFRYIVQADEKIYGKETHDLEVYDIADYEAELFDSYREYLREATKGSRVGANKDTINHKFIILRGLYHYYNALGAIKYNPLEFYEREYEPKAKNIVRLTREEVADIRDSVRYGKGMTLSAHQRMFYEKNKERDDAIICLLLGTGIRVSELVGADLSDLNFKDRSLGVVRKGDHADMVYFRPEVADCLRTYIDGERRLIKAKDPTPLFYSLQGERISVSTVERIVKKYAGFNTNKNITCHKLRSTYGTLMYEATNDLALTQDALGHSSPETTKRYYVDSHDRNMRRAGEVDIEANRQD